MTNKLKIVSDGTAEGTHVYASNIEIDGISKIEFGPIEPRKLVEVKLTFLHVEIDAVAELVQ